MWLSFVANVGLLVAKLYGFWLSHSYSVLASAADSLVDILSQASNLSLFAKPLSIQAAFQRRQLLYRRYSSSLWHYLCFKAIRHRLVAANCTAATSSPGSYTQVSPRCVCRLSWLLLSGR